MVLIKQGDRYGASHSGCRKFPLPVQVLYLNPIFPRVKVQDAIGTRIVGLHAMECCIKAGCINLVCKTRTNAHYELGTCVTGRSVVSYVNGGPHTAATKTGKLPKEAVMANVKFVKMQNASGRYAIFAIPGHKNRIYVDTALFPGGVTPTELEMSGMVPAGEEVVKAEDGEKAAAAAAKAQEKAEKVALKAAAAQEKAAARVAKAQAAAEAAIARAAKAAAAVAQAAQPEL
jgi:hypothetical protein